MSAKFFLANLKPTLSGNPPGQLLSAWSTRLPSFLTLLNEIFAPKPASETTLKKAVAMVHAPGFKVGTILICAAWIFARWWNASKGEPCLIAAPKYDSEMASFRSPRSDPLGVRPCQLAQLQRVKWVNVALLSFWLSIRPSRYMMPRPL